MRSFLWGRNQRKTGWLNELLARHPLSQTLYRCWRWAFVSVGCAAGCTTPQHPGHVVGPMQATSEMLTQAGDQMSQALTGRPRSTRLFSPTNGSLAWHGKVPMTPNMLAGGAIPAAPPASAIAGLPPGAIVIPQPNASTIPTGTVVAPTGATPIPTTTPKPSNFAVPPAPPVPLAVPPAPVAAKLPTLPTTSPFNTLASAPRLSAPPPATHTGAPDTLSLKTVSLSRPIEASNATPISSVPQTNEPSATIPVSAESTEPVAQTATANANTHWCQVRIRNISNKPIKKFSATILPPSDGQMVVRDTQTSQTLTVAQCDLNSDHAVGSGEELAVTLGLVTSGEKPGNLHIQVRDAQGGSQQAIQSRWQVIIEPAAAP